MGFFGKKKLERQVEGLYSRLLPMFLHSGCATWAEVGQKINRPSNPQVGCLHAICPACDEMCERRKMVAWPKIEYPPYRDGWYEELRERESRTKLYCPTCYVKIAKAHGKEAE